MKKENIDLLLKFIKTVVVKKGQKFRIQAEYKLYIEGVEGKYESKGSGYLIVADWYIKKKHVECCIYLED